jgi:beta-phosphoglucomutase-like phosphatase (HAD superfamily)
MAFFHFNHFWGKSANVNLIPGIFLQTAAGLGLLLEKCLVIENSTHGVKTAKTAGMQLSGLVFLYSFLRCLWLIS